MKMLGNGMRKYVMNRSNYKKEIQRVYDPRLEKYAIIAIKDLTLLAENLSEEEQDKIFNNENIEPFLRSLLSLKSDNEEKRRKRVIGLWDAIFSNFLSPEYGLKLVKKDTWQALTMQQDNTLKAIYYATRFRE